MNIYDVAHDLARALKESEEFRDFKRLNAEVMTNEEHRSMVEDFREKIIKYQLNNYGKEEQDEEELKKIQQLQNVLMMNPQIAEFMTAELKFSQLFDDINKILIEAIRIEK